jgi:hypothetical protein
MRIELTSSAWKAEVLPLNYTRKGKNGWASWIRTNACRSQSAMPYRLAIAQYINDGATDGNRTHECLNHNQVR